MTTLKQFLDGSPLDFTSFTGKAHTARWFKPADVPLHSLEIRDAAGTRQRWFFAVEHEAVNFYQTATDAALCGDIA